MDLHRIATLAHYLRHLQSDRAEAEVLFQELLIGVTSFFRDPTVFEALAGQGLPKLLDDKPDGSNIRVWVPACPTEEEAYSLAICCMNSCAGITSITPSKSSPPTLMPRRSTSPARGSIPRGSATT